MGQRHGTMLLATRRRLVKPTGGRGEGGVWVVSRKSPHLTWGGHVLLVGVGVCCFFFDVQVGWGWCMFLGDFAVQKVTVTG